MRRAICQCEPHHALAGEKRTWYFLYTPSTSLAKGARLKFDMQSNGRESDWELPVVTNKKGEGTLSLCFPSGKYVSAQKIEASDRIAPLYEFILPQAVEAGERVTIVLGEKEGEGDRKIAAQKTAQRRRPFFLSVDPSGKGQYEEPEVFTLDVRGGPLERIRILTPSFVTKNKRFDAVVRFEDAYGNLTHHAPEDTLIELSHEHLRENLSWKLFVPETGFISIPNLYFNEAGVYTLRLTNMQTGQVFRSVPIRCFQECEQQLFWGLLHGECERFDSTEQLEGCLRHFRDEQAFSFYGSSPFESAEETSNEVWKHIGQQLIDFNEEERFTTFVGFQWQGEPRTEGLRQIIYSKEQKALLRRKELKSNSLKKIYKSVASKELIAIPSFTMAKGCEYTFEQFDPDFERVAEIYNAWGCSEMTQKEKNPFPITSSKGGFQETAEGALQRALQRNCRIGFVAGGWDDRGVYEGLYESDQQQYMPGLTAILAPHHTRDALFEALYQRSCYATTGEKIILGFYIAGIPMGRETSTAIKPGLSVNRHISGYVAGSAPLSSVEIIRNGQVLHTFTPSDYFLDFTYDDMTPLGGVTLTSKDKRPSFVYYYLRVTQSDGHRAWSSPIWIDDVPLSALPKGQVRRAVPLAKPDLKKELPAVEEFDEEEYEEYEE